MTKDAPRKIALNFETVGSIAAMIVGVAAVYMAWDQGQVMRAQQHASVWPILAPDMSIDGDENSLFVELSVANEGVGPALVESAFVTVNGQEKSQRAEIMQLMFSDTWPSGAANATGADIEGAVIGAGDTVRVLRVTWANSEENNAAFQKLALRSLAEVQVSMSVCYCSVFDRCFVSKDRERPEEVRKCNPPTQYFSSLLSDVEGSE